MSIIRWGMIGCGDVTEMKSGPAFNKVPNSTLYAVMRRDAVKAKDYAQRHNVPVFYNVADDIINDPAVNAIYVATPPDTHEQFALAAIAAGKPVYLEKPMALNYESAVRISKATSISAVKLSLAHYRREQPIFKKLKALLNENAIGKVSLAEIKLFRTAIKDVPDQKAGIQWRLDPARSGGGLFHDVAPHQIDLLLFLFGAGIKSVSGVSRNAGKHYQADDLVSGIIDMESGVTCTGMWNFNAAPTDVKDELCIYGDRGKITVQVFQHSFLAVETTKGAEEFHFEHLQHVQQPMIEAVVRYFFGEGENPCGAEEGIISMDIIDKLTRK